MRDPHVERLHFEIGSGEGTSFERPDPLAFENGLGRFEARDGTLIVEPADHFASAAAALAVVDPFLRSWEIATDLDSNPGTIRFKFMKADRIDRNPPPPGSPLGVVLTEGVLSLSGRVATLVIRRNYPAPPGDFEASVNVTRAHARWLDYKAGHEPLQGMGYFVLTLVLSVGGVDQAASVYRIDRKVLRKISELTSTKGDPKTARKAPVGGGQFQELTGAEIAWLEHAIRRVIKRLGEHASGANLPVLTLNDLPKL